MIAPIPYTSSQTEQEKKKKCKTKNERRKNAAARAMKERKGFTCLLAHVIYTYRYIPGTVPGTSNWNNTQKIRDLPNTALRSPDSIEHTYIPGNISGTLGMHAHTYTMPCSMHMHQCVVMQEIRPTF